MERSALVTLILFFLFSCKENDGNKSDAHLTADIKQKESVLLTSYCFYELDDKYSSKSDSITIMSWLNEKSNLLLNAESVENIFNHNGGGPNGAEWNPSTNLYVAIMSPPKSNTSIKFAELFINGRPYGEKILEYNPNLTWYRVSRDFWENESRPITPLDISEMYSEDFLNSVKNERAQPITDLNYGEILKFEIFFKSDTLSKFFHITTGE